MLDGPTGSVIASLKVDGEIEGSPAVYNKTMVVGTTGKGHVLHLRHYAGLRTQFNRTSKADTRHGSSGSCLLFYRAWKIGQAH